MTQYMNDIREQCDKIIESPGTAEEKEKMWKEFLRKNGPRSKKRDSTTLDFSQLYPETMFTPILKELSKEDALGVLSSLLVEITDRENKERENTFHKELFISNQVRELGEEFDHKHNILEQGGFNS